MAAGKASGADWVSPDGAIAVAAPDPAKFKLIDNPPDPFLVLWVSKDQSLRLGVMKGTIPANIKLDRSSVEQGMAKEVNGRITSSSIKVKDGYEIWHMAARGSIQGKNGHFAQAVVQCGAGAYKVMAITVGNGPTDDATINAFLNSIQIKLPNSNPPTAQPANSELSHEGGVDLHNLSKRLGGLGLLVLIVLFVWIAIRRKRG